MSHRWRTWITRSFLPSRAPAPRRRTLGVEPLEGRLVPAVTLSGAVFDDLDGDGSFDTDESGISGVTVFIDADNSSTFDAGEVSATTDGPGAYTLIAPGGGTYKVRQVVPAGVAQTTTDPDDVVANETDAPNVHVGGHVMPGTISGVVFDDSDGNGVKGSGENGTQGVTVFLDADGDGSLDTGETSTVTGSDGAFSFTGLGPGA